MNINQNREGNKLTITIEGELNAITAPDLMGVVENELSGVTELIFDLEELNYTSSAGLRVLLEAQQIMDEQGSMTVRHANDAVMDIFEETGFTDILEIED